VTDSLIQFIVLFEHLAEIEVNLNSHQTGQLAKLALNFDEMLGGFLPL
jgi:hypothetical protein